MSKYELITLCIGIFGVIVVVIVVVIGWGVSVYLSKAQEKSATRNLESERQYRDNAEADKRRLENANKVVEYYVDHQLHAKNIPGLFIAGISGLENEGQAELVINQIERRISKNPLGRYNADIRQIGILHFFQNTTLEHLNIRGLSQVIEDFKNQPQ